MREVKGKFNLLYVAAVVLLLAVLSFAFGAVAYLGFSHTSYAVEGTSEGESTHSFHCAGITYSGDYASAPSRPYSTIRYRGISVTSVPANLDIKLQDGALVKYTVTDSTGAVLGTITTTDNNNLVVSDDRILKSTDMLTLNVEFTFGTYSVSYELYKGTLYGDDSTIAVNRNPSQISFSSLPALQAPTLAGYNFVRWYIMVGDEKESVEEFTYGIFDENNSVTLYADWTASSYKLTLYKDVDRSEIQKECYVQFGTSLKGELPESIPGDDGYKFNGWYYTTTNAKVAESATMPASDIALYAQYERVPAQAQINFAYEEGDNSVQHKFPVEKLDIQPGNYTFAALAELMGVSLGIEGHTYTVASSDGSAIDASAQLTLDSGELYEFTVSYKRVSYTVTVNYRYNDNYNDNSVVSPTVVRNVLYGDSVTIKSPKIDNFIADNMEWTESGVTTNRTKTIKYSSTETSKTLTLSDGTVISITNGEGGLAGATLVAESRGKDKLKSLSSSLSNAGFLSEAVGDYWIAIEGAKFGLLGRYKINIRAAGVSSDMQNPQLFYVNEDSYNPYDAQFGNSSVEFYVSAAKLTDGIEVVFSGLIVSHVVLYVVIGVVCALLVIGIVIFVLWFVLWRKMKLSFEVNGGDPIAPVKTKRNTVLPVPTPFREKAVFLGWFTDKALTVPAEYMEDEVVHAELDDIPYNDEPSEPIEYDNTKDISDVSDSTADAPVSEVADSALPTAADVSGKSIMMKKCVKLYAAWFVDGQPEDGAEKKDEDKKPVKEKKKDKKIKKAAKESANASSEPSADFVQEASVEESLSETPEPATAEEGSKPDVEAPVIEEQESKADADKKKTSKSAKSDKKD